VLGPQREIWVVDDAPGKLPSARDLRLDIMPLKDVPLFFDPGNLASSCKDCHDRFRR
jgi:hypothetical protein